MLYVIIGGICICIGYIIGSFVTAWLMKQKVYDSLHALEENLSVTGGDKDENQK